MTLNKISKDFFPITVAVLFLLVAGLIHRNTTKPNIKLNTQEAALNVHYQLPLFFSMGNKRLIADLFWIVTLMESDEEHYKGKDYNSWMYLRFLNIAVLDPLFYENYLYGGLYLSVVKDDPVGGMDIQMRGLKIYPEDYRLNYYLGMNYLLELDDPKNALLYLDKIKDDVRSKNAISLLVNKLKHVTYQKHEITLIFLRDTLNTTSIPFIREKLKSDIYAVKAEMDLKCLNKNGANCSRLDEDGIPYLYRNSAWIAAKKFRPYTIHKK